MRTVNARFCFLLSIFSGLSVVAQTPTPAPGAVTASTNAIGPKIVFATPIHDFGKTKAGEPVHYSYVFTNTGDQLLEVRGVQPSCGCTTAGQWTRQVKPGDSGSIAIQFNSANFNGPVFKTITVTSNAKDQPTTVLQLKGTVWKPIEFSPPYTVLSLMPDAPSASATVRVINNMEEPLQVWDPSSNNQDFSIALRTNTPGKEYQVTISATPPLHAGNVAARITLKTSSATAPTLDIPFWANIQPALMVMPPQIMLPEAPLTTKATPSITIQNNSTNQLTLSDAVVNVPGVDVQVREINHGRTYSVGLVFPQGYANPAGQMTELTIKSSSPRMPLIKVPIMQVAQRFQPPRGLPVTAPMPNQVRPLPPAPPKPTAQLTQ
ncbi:MAG: DUF1573 domain-containing protein [Limisphaerales bacterium]